MRDVFIFLMGAASAVCVLGSWIVFKAEGFTWGRR
jgi:hypothetical protein